MNINLLLRQLDGEVANLTKARSTIVSDVPTAGASECAPITSRNATGRPPADGAEHPRITGAGESYLGQWDCEYR
jgi:hypothetical protein